jgi:hypothetical protein
VNISIFCVHDESVLEDITVAAFFYERFGILSLSEPLVER